MAERLGEHTSPDCLEGGPSIYASADRVGSSPIGSDGLRSFFGRPR
jgi:hypothetical protein